MFGRRYGTPKEEVEKHLAAGKDVDMVEKEEIVGIGHLVEDLLEGIDLQVDTGTVVEEVVLKEEGGAADLTAK